MKFPIIFILIISSWPFLFDDSPERYELTLYNVHTETLFKQTIYSSDSLETIGILSKNGSLYSDGEYFFEIPPINKKAFQTTLEKVEYEPGFSQVDKFFLMVISLIAIGVCYGLFRNSLSEYLKKLI